MSQPPRVAQILPRSLRMEARTWGWCTPSVTQLRRLFAGLPVDKMRGLELIVEDTGIGARAAKRFTGVLTFSEPLSLSLLHNLCPILWVPVLQEIGPDTTQEVTEDIDIPRTETPFCPPTEG